jgi:NAD-dependent deacetylase
MRPGDDPALAAAALGEALRGARRTLALTGAGISTASGIPDFRSPSGLWADLDPREVGHVDAFRRDPARVWAFYARRIAVVREARPNAAHLALAALERAGAVRRVVTQNVDGLHRAAGSDAIEVHGRLDVAECLRCGARVEGGEVDARLRAGDGVPRCDCGRPLKPGVVLFGEILPAAAIDEAFALAEDADLVLALGTSLEVHPVAGLPSAARARGGRLAIANRGETALDDVADVRVECALEEVLPRVAAAFCA